MSVGGICFRCGVTSIESTLAREQDQVENPKTQKINFILIGASSFIIQMSPSLLLVT